MLTKVYQINTSLQQTIPYYQTINSSLNTVYHHSIDQFQKLSESYTQYYTDTIRTVKNIRKKIQGQIQNKTDIVLCKVQEWVQVEKPKESTLEIPPINKRIISILLRINKLFFNYQTNIRQYSVQTLQKAKKIAMGFYLPIYIPLKATTLVSKQMIMEYVQNKMNAIKVTYQSSKGSVTMFIAGNFKQEVIKNTVSDALKNFKQKTVTIVKKGLQIKVDKESLSQNYEYFLLKFIEAIKSMGEIGTENLISIKEGSKNLYKQIIERIKEKQILIQTQYINKNVVLEKEISN